MLPLLALSLVVTIAGIAWAIGFYQGVQRGYADGLLDRAIRSYAESRIDHPLHDGQKDTDG